MCSNNNSWTYINDKDGGYFLNIETGERQEAETYHFRQGSQVTALSPEQLKAYENKKKKYINKYAKRSDNPFYFVNKEDVFADIPPASLARLIYLNSFRNFKDNVLMLTQRKKMKINNLQEVLKISRMSVNRFLDDVCPKYLKINDDKTIKPNKDFFCKGDIYNKQWLRVFNSGIKALYEKCSGSSKILGYIFMMMPYINYKYNVLCFNPEETDKEKIQRMTVAEFCDNIGFDRKHYKRLIAQYNNIVFDVKGKKEKFCTYTNDGINIIDSYITVNPSVIYGGEVKNIEEVKIYGHF